MRYVCFKKALVVGIIVLFLGVGFQPAIANEVSITKTADVEGDCFDCRPVNRVALLKVKLLLMKLETITNVILSRFGHTPEVAEKCEEVLDIINSNRVLDYPFICVVLLSILFPVMFIMVIIQDIEDLLEEKFPTISYIFFILLVPFIYIYINLFDLAIEWDCIGPFLPEI